MSVISGKSPYSSLKSVKSYLDDVETRASSKLDDVTSLHHVVSAGRYLHLVDSGSVTAAQIVKKHSTLLVVLWKVQFIIVALIYMFIISMLMISRYSWGGVKIQIYLEMCQQLTNEKPA